ncbi:transposon Ty3-I Gag-Pol polyprotein [Trichonephila clavata]|uniref:RNA-directed DNA polymerase n=1 Tax=Trichonephila clavata TaxID=2740835 RepID=A0A8X6KZC7_TRICU|nr:transposon Ty3-I Gag-Pol polyprotein [Trichonephila clavata]
MIRIPIPGIEKTIYCDVSTGNNHKYIVPSFRQQVFSSIHNLSHPGIRCTRKLIIKRFIWPNLNKNCQKWSRTCLECPKSEVQRHTHSALLSFTVPCERFQHVHIDIVGPLPTYQGLRYLLTMIDRFGLKHCL